MSMIRVVAVLSKPALLGGALIGSALIAAPAAAAPMASRTPEQIVCDLTGDCGGKGEIDKAQQLERPDEAPFSFTRQDAAAAPVTKSSMTTPNKVAYATVPGSRKTVRAPMVRDRAAITGNYDMRINFELGSADLTEQAKAEAQAFAMALKSPATSGKRFIVEGHTDATGPREENLKLSQARAESVATYLQALGVESDRLEARGFGPDRPLPGRSPRAAVNRRVQFNTVG